MNVLMNTQAYFEGGGRATRRRGMRLVGGGVKHHVTLFGMHTVCA